MQYPRDFSAAILSLIQADFQIEVKKVSMLTTFKRHPIAYIYW